jgi:pimeloyl-ACP methyl ester carboxylesterase
VIPCAAHAVMFDAAKRFNRAILDFCAKPANQQAHTEAQK